MTLKQVSGHPLPYHDGDFGYVPDGPDDVFMHYTFTTQQSGFGSEYFLEWQEAADPPVSSASVYPGSIYMDDLWNTSVFLPEQFNDLAAGLKLHGHKEPAEGNFIPVPPPHIYEGETLNEVLDICCSPPFLESTCTLQLNKREYFEFYATDNAGSDMTTVVSDIRGWETTHSH